MSSSRYNRLTIMVDDITKLSDSDCRALSVGDTVECDSICFSVGKKEENSEILLFAFVGTHFIEVNYIYNQDNLWEYNWTENIGNTQFKVLYFNENGTVLIGGNGWDMTTTGMVFCAYKYDGESPIQGATVPLYNNNVIALAINPTEGEDGELGIETETTGNKTTATVLQDHMSYYRILIIEMPIQLM